MKIKDMSIILKVIYELARKRRKLEEKYGWNGDLNTYDTFKKSDGYKIIINAEKEIENFMMALEYDVLKDIMAIMYIGAVGCDGLEPDAAFEIFKETISWSGKKLDVTHVIEKSPLDKYIKVGCELLKINL